MYLLEMAIGVIIPLVFLVSMRNTTSLKSILGINILVIVGVLINRMNVCIFSMQEYGASQGAAYFPSLQELLITVGIVALGIFLFKMAAKHLPLFAGVN